MALIVASYPDPTDPTAPIADAYAWIADIHIDLAATTYWVQVQVHKSAAAASLIPPPRPLEILTIAAGDALIPAVPGDPPPEDEPFPEEGVPDKVPAVLAPSLLEVFTLAEIAKAADPSLSIWDAIKGVIYSQVALHTRLSPNTVV